MNFLLKIILESIQKNIDAQNSSPHLIIYKAQVASLFSILQRISGLVLFLVLVISIISNKILSYGLSNYFLYTYIIYFFSIDNMLIQIIFWFFLGIFLFCLCTFYLNRCSLTCFRYSNNNSVIITIIEYSYFISIWRYSYVSTQSNYWNH